MPYFQKTRDWATEVSWLSLLHTELRLEFGAPPSKARALTYLLFIFIFIYSRVLFSWESKHMHLNSNYIIMSL